MVGVGSAPSCLWPSLEGRVPWIPASIWAFGDLNCLEVLVVVGIHVVSCFTVTEERRNDSVGHLGSGLRSFQISRRDPWRTGGGHVFLGSSSNNMRDRGLGGSALGGYMRVYPSAEGHLAPHSGSILFVDKQLDRKPKK